MTKRTVSLTPEQAAFVDRMVADGLFADATAVVDAGLRKLETERAQYDEELAALKERLRPGLEDVAAGRYSPRTFDEIVEDGVSRSSAKRRR